MSNECKIKSSLKLKSESDFHLVESAIDQFKASVSFFSGEYVRGERSLDFDICFRGYGGETNIEVHRFAGSLLGLVEGGTVLYLYDFDTGEEENRLVPYFVGTPAEQQVARVNYGIGLCQPWIQPAIGESAFEEIRSLVLAQPVLLDELAPISKKPEVIAVSLDNGDCALFVNGDAIVQLDASDSGENPFTTGKYLAAALGVALVEISQLSVPALDGWSWNDVYGAITGRNSSDPALQMGSELAVA